jgi:DNA-binding NarL/FixJ family response regulator
MQPASELEEPTIQTPRKKARVLVVDDHELLRVALRGLLENEPDLEVCGEAADADEAFRLATEECPDVVIVDVALKSGNGLDLVKRIKAKKQLRPSPGAIDVR